MLFTMKAFKSFVFAILLFVKQVNLIIIIFSFYVFFILQKQKLYKNKGDTENE